jgi:hypothetical protein
MFAKVHDEYKFLCDSQIRRLETYKTHKNFISNLENGIKQKRYRKWLKDKLIIISKAKLDNDLVEDYTIQDLQQNKVKPFFDSIDDENEIINKFGRGLFDERYIRNAFSSSDQDIIIEIAKGYGAFDY